MTLLGWMHRKLKHNSIEQFKEVTKGSCGTYLSAQSPVNDWSCFGSRNGSESKQPNQDYEKSVSTMDTKGMEADISDLEYEFFHGFLAIGTLGLEPILSEPETPKFLTSLEDIAQGDTEVTENDLKLINDELERFLEEEAEEEGQNESLARSSSYVSIVTLSEKPLDGARNEEREKVAVRPLQGYLFGSSVELSETTVAVMKEKAPLWELFRRTKQEDDSTKKSMKQNMEVKQPHNFSKNSIKKLLKKLCASSGSPTLSTNVDSGSKKKKLHKVMQMFHRKVHPESSIAETELHTTNIENTTGILCDDAYIDLHLDGDNKWGLNGSKAKGWDECYETFELHNSEHSGYNSSGNREHWIKTDADYLVLEL